VLIATDAKRAVTVGGLNSLLGLPGAEITRICAELAKAGRIVMIPAPSPILTLPSVVADLQEETLARVAAFHKDNELQRGISKEELRKRFYDDVPLEVFRHCLDRMVEARQIVFLGEAVSLYGREIQLSEEEETLREMIEAAVLEAAYQPPAMAELQASIRADAEAVRRIFFWMLKEKILVKLSDDLIYHRETLEEMKGRIRAAYAPGARFGVADFKDLFGITRKHAIPLLEHFDREKFTRRLGNDRVLV